MDGSKSQILKESKRDGPRRRENRPFARRGDDTHADGAKIDFEDKSAPERSGCCSLVCYNCNQEGHKSRECLNPRNKREPRRGGSRGSGGYGREGGNYQYDSKKVDSFEETMHADREFYQGHSYDASRPSFFNRPRKSAYTSASRNRGRRVGSYFDRSDFGEKPAYVNDQLYETNMSDSGRIYAGRFGSSDVRCRSRAFAVGDLHPENGGGGGFSSSLPPSAPEPPPFINNAAKTDYNFTLPLPAVSAATAILMPPSNLSTEIPVHETIALDNETRQQIDSDEETRSNAANDGSRPDSRMNSNLISSVENLITAIDQGYPPANAYTPTPRASVKCSGCNLVGHGVETCWLQSMANPSAASFQIPLPPFSMPSTMAGPITAPAQYKPPLAAIYGSSSTMAPPPAAYSDAVAMALAFSNMPPPIAAPRQPQELPAAVLLANHYNAAYKRQESQSSVEGQQSSLTVADPEITSQMKVQYLTTPNAHVPIPNATQSPEHKPKITGAVPRRHDVSTQCCVEMRCQETQVDEMLEQAKISLKVDDKLSMSGKPTKPEFILVERESKLQQLVNTLTVDMDYCVINDRGLYNKSAVVFIDLQYMCNYIANHLRENSVCAVAANEYLIESELEPLFADFASRTSSVLVCTNLFANSDFMEKYVPENSLDQVIFFDIPQRIADYTEQTRFVKLGGKITAYYEDRINSPIVSDLIHLLSKNRHRAPDWLKECAKRVKGKTQPAPYVTLFPEAWE